MNCTTMSRENSLSRQALESVKHTPWRKVSCVLAAKNYRYDQLKTMDLSTRLWGINPTNSEVISQSLVLRSVVLGLILIY